MLDRRYRAPINWRVILVWVGITALCAGFVAAFMLVTR